MVVLLALAASICFAAAVVLQQSSAAKHGARWSLLGQSRWLLGGVADLVGFLLQTTALHLGALSTVQLVVTTSLPFGLLLGRARPGRDGWTGVTLFTVGLAGFLAVAAPRHTVGHFGSLVVPFVVVLAGAASVVLSRRTVPLATAAGCCFAVTAALAQVVGDRLTHGGPAEVLTHWEVYGLAVVAVGGLVLEQRAFASGPLQPSLVVLTLVDPVASVLLGVAVAGDRLRGGVAAVGAAGCGLVLAAGVVLLARRAPGGMPEPPRPVVGSDQTG